MEPNLSGTRFAKVTYGKQQDPTKQIHDKEQFKKIREQKSDAKFLGTKIPQTCSHYIIKRNKAYAIPFPLEKTGWKHPNSYQNSAKSVNPYSGYKTDY